MDISLEAGEVTVVESSVMPAHGNILIVDDQPDNLRALSALRVRAGYKVRTALNGQTALETVQALAPDLILLDIYDAPDEWV